MFKIKLTIEKPPDVTVRVWRVIVREAMKAGAEFWHKRYMAHHFTTQGAKKYGYQVRSNKYMRRKVDLAKRGKVESGGRVPLVYSGLLRRAAKNQASFRGFPTRARVTIKVPDYASRRPRDGKPYIMQELTRVTPDEVRAVSQVVEQLVIQKLEAFRQQKTVNIG